MHNERFAISLTRTIDVDRPHAGVLELVVLEQRSVSRRVLLPPRTLHIGRDEECDIMVRDPAASRRHALLHVTGELAIEDLESRNGTRLRGARLSPRQRTLLHAGDAVQIGATILLVQGATVTHGPAPGAGSGSTDAGGGPAAPYDPEMRAVHEWIARVSPTPLTVLISGETGVGKEVVAEAIHRASGGRSRRPLVRINCAALSASLLESELFGHEEGAFTGATRDKQGFFEAAHGGTAFLDEVGELPLDAQAKLLRVLETREVVRVGGTRPRRVDVRFVAATNRDLRAEVARGAFREDLFFRLQAARIVVPPLRRRPAELESLAAHFIDAFCRQLDRRSLGVAPATIARLRRYSWPGNIRELRHVVECAVLRAEGDAVQPCDLPSEIGDDPSPFAPEGSSPRTVSSFPSGAPLSESQNAERERIVLALTECHGNQTRAAERLRMPRRTLVAKLSAYGIPRPRLPRRGPDH